MNIVNRTALTWNVLIRDDEEAGCSDSLLSVVSSLTTKIDVVVPGGERPNGEFGAQARSNDGPKQDLSLGEPSSTSSHAQAASTKSGAITSNRPMTRKRRLDMITDVRREKPAKRTSTPRLRHDDSQIQFQPVDSSSPPRDESQHLTARQKEVRERQRENAALYSEVQSSSAPASSQSLPKQSDTRNSPRNQNQAGESTPKQAKSYEELISSTPTPRRGQVLQLEDFNDPPSSPPIPRPYPLLSEIQSRSRAGSAMESWEFSSPPGSPGGNHQAEQDSLLQSGIPEHTLPVKPGRSSSKRLRRSAARSRQLTEVVNREDAAEPAVCQIEGEQDSAAEPADRNAAVPQGVMTRARLTQEPTDSEGHLPVTTHSSSRRRSSRRMEAKSRAEGFPCDETTAIDSSDRRTRASSTAFKAAPADEGIARSIEQDARQQITSYECITVHTDTPSPSALKLPATIDQPKSPTAPSTPSAPPDQADAASLSGSRKKRKRAAKHGSRSKRRRTLDADVAQNDQQEHLPSSPVPVTQESKQLADGIETRSGIRRQRRQTTSNSTPTRKTSSYGQVVHGDGGDTDEELFSQLVTESNAASQSSQIDQIPGQTEDVMKEPNENTNVGADPTPNVALPELKVVEPRASTPGTGDKTLTIMDTLRSGLDQLRSASLTRERVYEVEDILMDMKRELFEAERRGRGNGRGSGRTKKTKSMRR